MPELQPKRIENTIVEFGLLVGIQRAKTRMVERRVVMIMMLNRPRRSPSQPGIMRPKTLNEKMISEFGKYDKG